MFSSSKDRVRTEMSKIQSLSHFLFSVVGEEAGSREREDEEDEGI